VTTAALIAGVAWVVFALAGPRLARRLPPALATRVLATGAVFIAASSVLVAASLVAIWVAQVPPVSRLGPWSAAELRSGSPVPIGGAVVAAALLLGALVRLGVTAGQRVRAMAAVRRSCRNLPAADGLIVVDSDRADAFATPMPAGRIVVTTGLLRALSGVERRALLAHERSHLGHRHGWWVLSADLAAATNPLLWWTARAVRHAVERWADEDAAREVGDRALTARTVARVALLIKASREPVVATASGGDVPERVRALLDAPPRIRPLPAAGLASMLAFSIASGAVTHVHTDIVFDRAATAHDEGCEREGHGC
jgi:Zn-dependent protease with chaperone function